MQICFRWKEKLYASAFVQKEKISFPKQSGVTCLEQRKTRTVVCWIRKEVRCSRFLGQLMILFGRRGKSSQHSRGKLRCDWSSADTMCSLKTKGLFFSTRLCKIEPGLVRHLHFENQPILFHGWPEYQVSLWVHSSWVLGSNHSCGPKNVLCGQKAGNARSLIFYLLLDTQIYWNQISITLILKCQDFSSSNVRGVLAKEPFRTGKPHNSIVTVEYRAAKPSVLH